MDANEVGEIFDLPDDPRHLVAMVVALYSREEVQTIQLGLTQYLCGLGTAEAGRPN